MKKVTFQTRVWSPDDLEKYYGIPVRNQSTLSSFQLHKHYWQSVRAILTKGDMGDSELSEPTYPMTSLEVSRRIQMVRHYQRKTMKTIKTMKTMKTMSKTMKTMKSNAGGSEGKTAIPAKRFLQQVSDIYPQDASDTGWVCAKTIPYPISPNKIIRLAQ